MKLSIATGILSALQCLNAWGQTSLAELLLDPDQNVSIAESREVSIPIRPDSALEFINEIRSLVQIPDPKRLRSLYCQDDDEDLIVASMSNLERVLKEGKNEKLGFWLKELDQLPERSREVWGGVINKLTSRDASGVCMIVAPGGTKVMIVVRRTNEGLKIVVEDRVLSNK